VAGLNLVQLIGHVGRDPEVKYLANGTTVANLSIATSESYTKDGEKKTITEWHKLVAFGRVAEIIGEYVKKGSQLYVEGKLKTRNWEDKEGAKKYITSGPFRCWAVVAGQRSRRKRMKDRLATILIRHFDGGTK
jgi:single-strand DNA-binding protein